MALDFFGADGPIARALAGFEARPQQQEMATAVHEALRGGHHLAVEAGTGVGKSFAYLVPAIELALDAKTPVVVSTHTISLQDQLVSKDIPFLKTVLPREFTAVLVKGRSNYLCRRRLDQAQEGARELFMPDRRAELARVLAWSAATIDGTRQDLTPLPAPEVWQEVQAETNNCLGPRCRYYAKECFFQNARRRRNTADLLVVNHALLFADLALKQADYGLLPKYEHLVVDEAHTMEQVAGDHLGIRLSEAMVKHLLSRLAGRQGTGGVLRRFNDAASLPVAAEAREACDILFDRVERWTLARPKGDNLRVRESDFVEDPLSGALRALCASMKEHCEALPTQEARVEYRAQADRAAALADETEAFVSHAAADQVYWIETSGAGARRNLELRAAPIDLAEHLRRLLFDRMKSVICTSATLAAGPAARGAGGFAHFLRRTGLQEARTALLGSPFDYQRRVTVHVARRMPEPNDAGYEDILAERVSHYVRLTRGRAFVLFTSYRVMRALAERLRNPLLAEGITLLVQGEGVASQHLLETFKREPACALFGTDTFWQGVDVPGEALSNVIITKLPFPSPGHPLTEARMERIEAAGGDSFRDYSIPEAVMKFRQGFGRLIRRATDTGIVAILDGRVATRSYGRIFLASIPKCPVVEE
ncbi:MAG: helicase [Planctomycetes bacterium]|nr:helicase [Planctomycetota bacterium]